MFFTEKRKEEKAKLKEDSKEWFLKQSELAMRQFELDIEWWKKGQDANRRETRAISQSVSTPKSDIEGLDYCISTLENLLQPFKEDAFEKLTPKERERVHGAINMASIFWERVKEYKK